MSSWQEPQLYTVCGTCTKDGKVSWIWDYKKQWDQNKVCENCHQPWDSTGKATKKA